MSMDFVARDAADAAAMFGRRIATGMRSAPKVAFAGDSFYDFAVNRGGLPLLYQYTNFSAANWLRWRFGDRMRTDAAWFTAAGGTRTDHLLTVQLPQILASGVDLVLVNCGTNNIGFTTATEMVADMKAFIAQTSARGIGVIWNLVIPQNSWSSARFQQASEFNRQLAGMAAQPGNCLWVADSYPAMVDFATGLAVSARLTGDGVHPCINGAIAMEQAIADRMEQILPPCSELPTYSPHDQYDVALNPSGNLIHGGMFAGSGGNLINGGTGQVASYWTGGFGTSGGTTMTAEFSKGLSAGYTNLPVQNLTIGGTADGNVLTLQATEAVNGSGALIMPTGIAAGMRLQATFRLNWSGLSNIKQIVARLSFDAAGQTYEVQDGASGLIAGQYSLGEMPADRADVILCPAALTLGDGFSNVRMRIQVAPLTTGQAVAGLLGIQQASLRVVA